MEKSYYWFEFLAFPYFKSLITKTTKSQGSFTKSRSLLISNMFTRCVQENLIRVPKCQDCS
jgi:hypothetical protein